MDSRASSSTSSQASSRGGTAEPCALDRIRLWTLAPFAATWFVAAAILLALVPSVPPPVVGSAVVLLTAGTWVGTMVWRNGLSLPALFGRCPATIRDGALLLGAVAGVYLLGRFEWSILIPALETHAPALADIYRASSTDGSSIPLTRIVLAVVVAPVVEEVIFRGVIYSRCARYWGSPVLAMLISSLLFTMLHGHVLSSFVFGVVAVCLYMGTGSLWTPIAFHAALNGIAAAGWSVQPHVTAWTALSDLAFGSTCLVLTIAILAPLFGATRQAFCQPLPYLRDT